MRVLYLQPGLVPPPRDRALDMMFHIPDLITGAVLLPTWARSPEDLRSTLGEDAFPEYRVGNFIYHLLPAGKYPHGSLRQKAATLLFFLQRGWQLHRQRKFDCILSYGWTLTGLAALILSRITGAKLIIEFGGVPQDAYKFAQFGNTYGAPAMNWSTHAMRQVSRFLLHLVVLPASRVRLFYPDQLSHFPRLAEVPVSVSHPFVPLSLVPYTGISENSILLVGSPWYVKGVDVLIRAFRRIESEFPDSRLKLLGHFPEQGILGDLTAGSQQIEILKARSYPETLEVIANTGIFALASRTECAARVLMEAMAAGKPLVASRVGGTPHYVKDGVNGFLFESENDEELAEKLRLLLGSPELRAQMGARGRELAWRLYTEKRAGEDFRDMIEATVNSPR